MNVILVPGTWGDDDQWWRLGVEGNFADALRDAGHRLLGSPGREFCWSTNLGGFDIGKRDLKDWEAGGRHFQDYVFPSLCLTGVDPASIWVVSHSHGRQVTRYGLQSMHLKVGGVIFVSGPVRKDVNKATPDFRSHVDRLYVVNGKGWADKMQWFGEMGDGAWGWTRNDPEADQHTTYPDATHSSLLNDPDKFDRVVNLIPR